MNDGNQNFTSIWHRKKCENTLNMTSLYYKVSRLRNQIISHVQVSSDTRTYHTARHVVTIIQQEVEFSASPDINGPMEKQSQIVVKPLDLQNRSFSSVYCQLKWFSKLMGGNDSDLVASFSFSQIFEPVSLGMSLRFIVHIAKLKH